MLSGVAEGIPESKAISLPVTGEPGTQALLQQLAALFQHQFELFHTDIAVRIVDGSLQATVIESA